MPTCNQQVTGSIPVAGFLDQIVKRWAPRGSIQGVSFILLSLYLSGCFAFEDFKSRRQWPLVFDCLLNGKLSIFVRAAIGSFVPFTIVDRCTNR